MDNDHACRLSPHINEAWKNGDTEALDALVHEEFVFNPHVGGHTMGR